MITVSVTAWQPGFKTISFVKLLREGSQSQRTFPEAKSMVDRLVASKPFTVDFPNPQEAADLRPSTWGEAVQLRIRDQDAVFRNTYPNGSPFTGAR